jgi:hypothetical protein
MATSSLSHGPGGGKPVEIRAVPGQHKLEVKKDGFKTFGEVVTLKTDESTIVNVRLDPPTPLPAPNQIPPAGPARRAWEVTGAGWSVEGDQLVKEGLEHSHVRFGDRRWTDYDFTFEMRKSAGRDGLYALYRVNEGFYMVELGCGFNRDHTLVRSVDDKNLAQVPGTIRPLEWYRVKISVRGPHFRIELDYHVLFTYSEDRIPNGGVGLGFYESAGRFRNIKVTAPDGTVLWEGPPDLPEK